MAGNHKCPNLVEQLEWVILLCKKGDHPYTPDFSELKQFCKNRDYMRCPFFTPLEKVHTMKN